MTDTTITIDIERIAELVEQYRQAEAREEQRRIENEVLAETVWQEMSMEGSQGATLSDSQVELVYSELPDDAEEAKRVLRRIHLDGL
jgi:hypothetical protein